MDSAMCCNGDDRLVVHRLMSPGWDVMNGRPDEVEARHEGDVNNG